MAAPRFSQVPPLRTGDRLTREEFERRYDAMPGLKKAELIEGVVTVPSPVRFVQHGNPHFDLNGWLAAYATHTPGVRGGNNTTIRLDLENEPQPDLLLIILPASGGQAEVDPEGCIAGAPELVAEISASTSSIDLQTKLRVYRRNRVREYLVWRVEEQFLDWFVLHDDQYERLPLTAAGYHASEVFPGLRLDPAALNRSEMPLVLQVLQQGLNSSEHADFVARLQQAATRQPGASPQ